MDKQELYVATSRARGETRLYLTPEIGASREEYAPSYLNAREAIPQIADAAERDRAQLAAHDVARLRAMPTTELEERRSGTRETARMERDNELERVRVEANIAECHERLDRYEFERARVEMTLRGRPRRSALEQLDGYIENWSPILAEREAELARLMPLEYRARAELEVADQILAERKAQAFTAFCLDPPPYIVNELGERPRDPGKARSWDEGVRQIERYRDEHGITDRSQALGPDKGHTVQRDAQHRLAKVQRELGLRQQIERTRTRDLGHSLEIGL